MTRVPAALVAVLAVLASALFACEPAEHNGPVNALASARGHAAFLSEPLLSGGRAVLEITHTTPGDWDFRETRLVSSDPDVIRIASVGNTADASTAQLVMGRPGPTVITLFDADGDVLAELPAEVQRADRLLFTADTLGQPLTIYIDSIPWLGRHFTVEAGGVLTFEAFAYAGSDLLLGDFGLTAAVLEPDVSPDDRLAPFDPVELATGHFTVEIATGDHDVYISALGTGATAGLRLTGTTLIE